MLQQRSMKEPLKYIWPYAMLYSGLEQKKMASEAPESRCSSLAFSHKGGGDLEVRIVME